MLGLGYVAFQSGDFTDAERYFLQAAERASDAPAMQAEALLGAGRTALVQNRPRAARRHFRNAEASGQDTPSSAWIANGLAVVATLRGEHERAETYYTQALRRSAGHPRIAANHVRMLIAAGRIDDATRAYTEHPPTYWADDDGPALSLLVEESRRNRFRQGLADPPADASDTVPEDSEAQSGTMSRQSGRDTPQLASPDPVRPSTEVESRGISRRRLDFSIRTWRCACTCPPRRRRSSRTGTPCLQGALRPRILRGSSFVSTAGPSRRNRCPP